LDWPTVKRMSQCPPCTPCSAMALATWFASPKLTWSALQLESCAVRLERYSVQGNLSVPVSAVKYALEAAGVDVHGNCTRAASQPVPARLAALAASVLRQEQR
jgi:hypothetical protein